jgi:hypothetical protein
LVAGEATKRPLETAEVPAAAVVTFLAGLGMPAELVLLGKETLAEKPATGRIQAVEAVEAPEPPVRRVTLCQTKVELAAQVFPPPLLEF